MTVVAALLLAAAPATVPVQTATVVARFPHDSGAFTQGLVFDGGRLFESTGLVGRSTIREVALDDGMVLRSAPVPPPYFGEGLAAWGDRLISLTWQHGIGFVWDRDSFRRIGSFRYEGEGWGLTRDRTALIMSDGTAVLRFLDPKSFAVKRRLTVTAAGRPVPMLNELECVKGEILANVWMTDRIARIDPATGRVKAWIDLSALARASGRRGTDAVLNGIAYDSAGDRLFVTGKTWPTLYQIRLDPPR